MAYFDEQPTNSLLYSLSTGVYAMGEVGVANYTLPVNQQVFQAQFDTIRKLAEQGYLEASCPRCGAVYLK